MSKQAFDKIAAGLQDAIDLATAERLTGIPAATLSDLRSGEMVAVPREVVTQIDFIPDGAPASMIEASAWVAAAMGAKRAMLAAAKDARHD